MIHLKRFLLQFNHENDLEVVYEKKKTNEKKNKKEQGSPEKGLQIQGPRDNLVMNPPPKTFGEILVFLQQENPHVLLKNVVLSYLDRSGSLQIINSDIDLDKFYCQGANFVRLEFASGCKEDQIKKSSPNFSRQPSKSRGQASTPASAKPEGFSISEQLGSDELMFYEIMDQGKLLCLQCKGKIKDCALCKGSPISPLPQNLEIIRGYINYKLFKLEEKINKNFHDAASSTTLSKGRGASIETKEPIRLKSGTGSYMPGKPPSRPSKRPLNDEAKQRVTRSFNSAEMNLNQMSPKAFQISKPDSPGLGTRPPINCSECGESIVFKTRYSCRTCYYYEICAECYNGKKGNKTKHIHPLLPQTPRSNQLPGSPSAVGSQKRIMSKSGSGDAKYTRHDSSSIKRSVFSEPGQAVKIETVLDSNLIKCKAGQPFQVDVTVKNKSPRESFPPNTFLVHSCEKTGEMLNRIPIPELAPGTEIKTQIQGVAPKTPGKFVFFWQFSVLELLESRLLSKDHAMVTLIAAE